MDLSVRKIELIEWLARLQDESLLSKVEALKKSSIQEVYDARISYDSQAIEKKLSRAEEDIKAGRVHTQEEVETFFKNKVAK